MISFHVTIPWYRVAIIAVISSMVSAMLFLFRNIVSWFLFFGAIAVSLKSSMAYWWCYYHRTINAADAVVAPIGGEWVWTFQAGPSITFAETLHHDAASLQHWRICNQRTGSSDWRLIVVLFSIECSSISCLYKLVLSLNLSSYLSIPHCICCRICRRIHHPSSHYLWMNH